MNSDSNAPTGSLRILVVSLVAALILGSGPVSLAVDAPVAPHVTLAIAGTDVVMVLKDLAEQAHLNIVASKNVTGKVTLFVTDVPLWDAFELILVSNELAAERQGDLLYVMPAREYELTYGQPYRDKRVAKTLPLKYAKAAQVSTVLAQAKSSVGKIMMDEGSNTLFLVDAPGVVQQMADMVTAMDVPTARRTFVLNYAKVKDLAVKVQDTLTKGLGTVQSDERANALIVTDTPVKLVELTDLLHTFDQRSRQVLIEAKIVQVSLSDKFQMGVDWASLVNKFITVKGLGALNLATGGQLKIATPDLANRGDYKVVLEALRTFGDTKILSEPRITALNGQEAKILVGSKEPYVTQTVSQAGTGTAVTAEQVTFLDVGVKLFVTPTIAQDGFVQLKIRPEVSSKTGTLTTAQKNEIPIVETSEAETSLLVQEGATIILGGLMKDEKSKDHQRIPVLGDLPILGYFFRTTKDTTKRTELLVFLTPHIVTGARTDTAPAVAAAMSGDPAPVQDGAAYYRMVWELVQGVAKAQTSLAPVKGTVVIEFRVRADGRLQGTPLIVSTTDPRLKAWAIRAVQVAAPFPPFLPEGNAKPQTIKVALTAD